MENESKGQPERPSGGHRVTEEELRRLYPQYDAQHKYLENRPFIFRYGPLRLIYSAIADMWNSFRGQIKDPSSNTGWRKPTAAEERQIIRNSEKVKRDKRR